MEAKSDNQRFVYFDLGNVLALFSHRLAAQNIATICNKPLEEVMDKLFVTDLQTRYETGLVSSRQYCDEVNATFGCNVSHDAIMHAISDMFQPNWPILEALELVRQAGVPMGVLSNTCEAHWQWLLKTDWPMLHGWYKHIILSYEVFSMKPDDGIYAASEQRCGCSGDKIFFTDDRADNIAAASSRGWATHQYQSNVGLLQSLKSWLGGE
jgi:FMN phosphatase YigB (HAD superfamily)